MKDFHDDIKVFVISHIQSNVLQRTALLLFKLHAWINELDGRGMLSVNQF